MSREEITLLLIFGGGGAVFGVVVALTCALVFHRACHAILLSAIVSLLGAPATALIFFGVSEAINSVERFGFDLRRMILAGISTMFFYMVGLSFVCGIPALFTALATQILFQCHKMLK